MLGPKCSRGKPFTVWIEIFLSLYINPQDQPPVSLSLSLIPLSLPLRNKKKKKEVICTSVIQEKERTKKMRSSRRRQCMDYISPCSSSNKKRLDLLLHHPLHWSNTNTTAHSDDEESLPSASAAKSSDQMLMMMAMMMGRERGSSFGSCGGGLSSLGSLMDHCPPTPSPVCSPVSSLSCTPPSELCCFSSQVSATADDPSSFATPNQSSCIISNDGKKSASLEEVVGGEEREEGTKVERRKASSKTPDHPSPKKMAIRGGEGSSIQAPAPKPNHKLKSIRTVRRRFPRERNDSLETSKCSDDGRLPTVSEEQEDRGHSKNRNHLTMSSRLSSGDDGYYTGSSGSGSGDNNSDMESMIEERLASMTQAWERPYHGLAAQTRRNGMEDKLMAWKEARTMKLMNKLRKEAEAIDEWEKKQITRAKMDMKEFEIKLDKRRSRAMEKMQRKIRTTQKKAEKKKLKEQAAAAKKIATVNKAFDKISSTGKLPWMLVFV
ncbi:uncharacterized protein LOC103716556 isoform X1 [Phoenix dactylifera]|uniref:Uncharacterized protein LOC103716556 isoform X1 n=1 Tax=Phoenix dactylifera TaxID=42345 RepID=A0A8B8ZYY7_PHODC|nr:uncharacterized protein LOC103716556 isoform X1 [Phoenix dactylifera]